MKSYTAYLFDADGTLLDTTELIYQCFLYTCRKFGGYEITRKKVYDTIGIPLRAQVEIHLGKLSDEHYEKVRDAHMAYQQAIYKEYLKLFPGVIETLTRLKQDRKKLAVVTSRRMDSLTQYLKETGILNLFDALITPESTLKHKPDPEPALEAIAQLKCQPSETLFVGDSVFDILCGKGAGTDTAFVTWSICENIRESELKPTFIINSMEELIGKE
jgi:pyrophosphatase PpaX